MPKPKKIAVLIGLSLLTPLLLTSLASLLMLFNSVNPMQLAFVSSFRVDNRTTQPLWVTPIGTFNSGAKGVLPQFALSFPAIPAFRSRDLRVESAGPIWIIYDCDDINFSEILVRDAQGEYRQPVVDPNPPKVNYYRNKQERYVIEGWELLSLPATDVVAAARSPDRQWRLWGLFVTGFVVMGLFLWLRRIYRRVA
jgi:hypothetical protein